LIVQEETAGGEQSNFNKIVSRDSVESAGGSRSKTKSTSARSSGSRKSTARSEARPSASSKNKKSKAGSHKKAA
jgi:hypothetical protein